MRNILALFIMVSLAVCVYPAGALPAQITGGSQNTLIVTNCQSPQGGPTSNNIMVSIDNPMPVQMKVSFKYLDLATGTYVDQPYNTYCYVPPSSSKPDCKFVVPIQVGGTGNGTLSNVELIRLSGGDSEGANPNAYTTSFTFNIVHTESLQESNVLSKINGAMSFLSKAASAIPCYQSVCCGMGGASAKSDTAKADIESAKSFLKTCDLSSAYSSASDAYESAKSASSATSTNTASCTDTLSAYKDAKAAVDSASAYLVSLNCVTDSASKDAMDAAKSKLKESEALISSDDYENAKLALEGATRAASTAKTGACQAGSSGGSPPSSAGAGTGTPAAGGNAPSGNSAPSKGEPLCPLGLALPSLVVLAAFAYSKR